MAVDDWMNLSYKGEKKVKVDIPISTKIRADLLGEYKLNLDILSLRG